jgi:hypothetical protein
MTFPSKKVLYQYSEKNEKIETLKLVKKKYLKKNLLIDILPYVSKDQKNCLKNKRIKFNMVLM